MATSLIKGQRIHIGTMLQSYHYYRYFHGEFSLVQTFTTRVHHAMYTGTNQSHSLRMLLVRR